MHMPTKGQRGVKAVTAMTVGCFLLLISLLGTGGGLYFAADRILKGICNEGNRKVEDRLWRGCDTESTVCHGLWGNESAARACNWEADNSEHLSWDRKQSWHS